METSFLDAKVKNLAVILDSSHLAYADLLAYWLKVSIQNKSRIQPFLIISLVTLWPEPPSTAPLPPIVLEDSYLLSLLLPYSPCSVYLYPYDYFFL